ncbi:triose-phosphate isomerase [Trueperella sp. LYQ143]|uniref:triose-phosphate isomerase n=1 Tax=unclassified Trueperella TaxID=2630174 RepID=UPI003983CC09
MYWVGTSWKMNGTLAFARQYAQALRDAQLDLPNIQPFIIPSFTAINAVHEILGEDSAIQLGAQNAHWEDAGAWTGEVSMLQAKDAGAQLIEMGHSERREFFGETDKTVNLKVKAALAHGLRPLVCFGEPLEVFQGGGSIEFITAQIDAALDGVADTSQILLAYEPIWAIGEHGREPEPEDLAAAFAALDARYGQRVAAILYGGSVNHANNQWLLQIDGVGGLFIGRSAWSAEGYLKNLQLADEVLN